MHDNGSLGVPVRTEASQDYGKTFADILTEDQRECHGEGNLTSRRKCLQDTDGGRGTLNNRGNSEADQNTDHGIREGQEHLLEGRAVL